MLQNNSEFPGGGYPPPPPAGSNSLTRLVVFVRRTWWVIVSLLSLLLAAQSIWPEIAKSGPTLGPVAQRVLETLFDKPAAVRQSDYLGKNGLPFGFLGYIYYVGQDCNGVKAGLGTIVALPCVHSVPPKSTDFAVGQVLRVNGDVEIREQPWDTSALVAMAQTGQCVKVVARPVRQSVPNDDPQFPGRWLPIGRTACPEL